MDRSLLAALIEAHVRFPAALRAILPIADLDRMRAHPAEGRWSPLEIVCHLRDEEVLDFRARARAVAENRKIETSIDPVGWVTARAYNQQDPEAVLADLERERAASCVWLATLTPEDLERTTEHARLGKMRCGDFVAAWRMHDLLHLRQIATALVHLSAAHLPGYRLDYAGTLPPLAG